MHRDIKKAIIIFGGGAIILVGLLILASWIFSMTADNAEKHFNTGKLLRSEGRREEAAAKFERAIRVKPEFRDAWYYLGMTLEELGRVREARDAWQKYVDLARDIPSEEQDVKVALSHIDAIDHPERYRQPPPKPLPASLVPFDSNKDNRLDGFDWNSLNAMQRDELLIALGVANDRLEHIRWRLNQYFTTDRVTRRLLNLSEDLYTYDPNMQVADVLDQYFLMSDFQKMNPEQRISFLSRNKVVEKDLPLFEEKIRTDSVANRANIRLRDEVYYLQDWGLLDAAYKLSFMKQLGLGDQEARKLIDDIEEFYSDPALRNLRIDEVYRKLR